MADEKSTKSDGGGIPEESPAKAPGGPKSPITGAGAAKPAGGNAGAQKAPESAPAEAPAPEVPEGFVLFENTHEKDSARFTLRDGENNEREFKCAPGKTVLVPKPYADLVPNRAPQLRRVAG